jgi:MFS family permease
MGSALNPINSSVIATALVSIAAAMGVPVGRTSILISSLYLTCAVAQPTAGRLAEEFGPRRIFLAGIAIVLAGGIIGGLGQNLMTLVVARVLIGLGTSAGYPSAMLLIRRRATAVGLQSPPLGVLGGLAIAGAATVAIGPTIGGLLVGWFSWRAAFLVNIPVTVITFAMALLWIAKDPDRIGGHSLREVVTRVDLLGVVGFGGSMTALLVFLLGLPRAGWTALGISVVLAGALVWWELRAANPFLDMRLLVSNLPLTRTYVRNGLTLVAHGMSAYEAGSVATFFLTSHSPIIAIIGTTALVGLMSGASNVSNQTALYKEAPAEKVGTASGLLRTFGYVGSIASATITGIVFRVRVDDTGLRHVSVIMIGIGIVVLLMTAFDRQLARSDQVHAHEQT